MIKAKMYHKYLTEDSNLSIKVIAAYTPKMKAYMYIVWLYNQEIKF